jgi:hypothetical protein
MYVGDDSDYLLKRLEGAGLVVPRHRTGPPGAGISVQGYEPTATLTRLVELLRTGRAGLQTNAPDSSDPVG